MHEAAIAGMRRAEKSVRGTSAERSLWLACGQIAEALAAAGQADPALELVGRIEDPAIGLEATIALARRLEAAGLPDRAREAAMRALQLADRETDTAKRSMALGSAAVVLADVGMADEADTVATRIGSTRSRHEAFIGLLESNARRNLTDAATHAADSARDTALQVPDLEGRWGYLVKLARILIRLNRGEQARDVARLLHETAIEMSAESSGRSNTIGVLAMILAEAGLTQEAHEVSLAAIEAARRVSGPRADRLRSVRPPDPSQSPATRIKRSWSPIRP